MCPPLTQQRPTQNLMEPVGVIMKFPTSIVSYLKTILMLAIVVSTILYAQTAEDIGTLCKLQFRIMVYSALTFFVLSHRFIANLFWNTLKPHQKYAFLALQPFWCISP